MTTVTTTTARDLEKTIETRADAIAYVQDVYGAVANAADVLGDGYHVISDKEKLVKIPFIILGWEHQTGDNGNYLSIRAFATIDGTDRRIVINDGGAGMLKQIRALEDAGITGGVLVNGGLRRSTFPFDKLTNKAYTRGEWENLSEAQKKNAGWGTTYYLSTDI